MKSTKAQLKMWTTIAVLIVFFVLLMFGFIFYANVESITLDRAQKEAEARRSIAVAQVIVNLPELQCSMASGVEKGICFDLYKALAFKEKRTSYRTHYYSVFGYANITLRQIEPSGDNITLYDYTGNKKSFTKGFIPISIYNPINKTFSFGVVEVNSYYGK